MICMKKKRWLCCLCSLLSIFISTCFSGNGYVIAQTQAAAASSAINSMNIIDHNLMITWPLLMQKVRGKVPVKGKATAGSFVKITVTSEYYELGTDRQHRKLFKGNGPIKVPAKTVQVKTAANGYWSCDAFTFRNHGWSERFRIVARSVQGGNATYVVVTDETKPIVEWD